MRRRILGALVVTTLVGWTAGCSATGHGRKAAPPGTVITASVGSPAHMWVMLPIGRVDFDLTEPTTKLPTHDKTYDRAGDGSAFIGVSWSWDFSRRPVSMLHDSSSQPVPKVTLVVGGKRYSLDHAMRANSIARPIGFDGTAWVAVADPPKSLREAEPTIEVEYDGLTQKVAPGDDLKGDDGTPADALYRPPEQLVQHTEDCGPARSHAGWKFEYDACSIDVRSVPYYQPVKWASSRDGWIVVDVRATPGAVAIKGSDSGGIEKQPPHVRYSLDGIQPTRVIPPREGFSWGRGSVGDTLVFDASKLDPGNHTLTINAEFSATGVGSGGTTHVPVTWSGRVQ